MRISACALLLVLMTARLLVATGATPEVALIEACERGDEAAVRSMLDTKVNIEAGGHLLPTPLVAATTVGLA